MNIGDKVRLLHGNEEGVITKISSGGRIEIEIEEGFRIPVMKNEIVLIHEAEQAHFKKAPDENKKISPSTSKKGKPEEQGLFLAYLPNNDKVLSLFLINAMEKDQHFSVSQVYGENSITIGHGMLQSLSSTKLLECVMAEFEQWPPLQLSLHPINRAIERTQPPLNKTIKFKASTFFRSKSKAPILGKDGYVFNIAQANVALDVQKLNRELQGQASVSLAPQFKRPPKEVDLHIEKLSKEHEFLSNSEIIKFQMDTFEKNLNYAIASGMDEITFIHGIGNGILKKEIHKYLSQFENIKYFQDTQKNRFGYGATLVKIK
ncbi:Smr/MutS family protein [Pararhodonellum marinum]|uniref:Smr/MutS family protein n=1 Tax=Pararhodonellum marinum TaxID=2755358 RepID=UPI00189015CC|nr:Smr/MutS family protein [Pararhodonellum marinum]